MYNAVVVQCSKGVPIRTFAASVVDGIIVASEFLTDTGLEGTPMYEDYLYSHFLSRGTTFAVAGGDTALPEPAGPTEPAAEPSPSGVSSFS